MPPEEEAEAANTSQPVAGGEIGQQDESGQGEEGEEENDENADDENAEDLEGEGDGEESGDNPDPEVNP